MLARRIQIHLPPGAREVDFSSLAEHAHGAALDAVSIADLLRNAFVYPPHSIYQDVKVAIIAGFDPAHDLHEDPRFRFVYRPAPMSVRPPSPVDDEQLLKTYHELLCEAVAGSCAGMRSPWLLQSGGKDSTSMAIALAEAKPQATCITYLGGHEENEVDSARFVARQLGLRHEALVCDPGRAYDRYLAMVPRMPLLTADFAMLSYADLATEIAAYDGDGIVDAMGSDPYFGLPTHWRQRVQALLARSVRLPRSVLEWGLIDRNFKLCYALGTLQMNGFERFYPGSRFSDAEVDALFGREISGQSRQRLETFRAEITAAGSMEERRRLAATIVEAATFGKGMYAANALALRVVYPYCDARLCDWVFREVPHDRRIGPGGVNKVLVRRHIARHFEQLPYVKAKGCFRFDLCGLARQRFEQVYGYAVEARDLLPGAPGWLLANRHRLDNKYFASKFYLLAITLPWLHSRLGGGAGAKPAGGALP
ncbi:asparagine synthase-related protein [Frateuria defendens]|uniref:asparagine synthase-related protein n=1 Tax=Frateuria defendens TaxID=2219559 RepID=UPI00066FEF67|nr:asparagine synthase-related protein [Frateuria defendens]